MTQITLIPKNSFYFPSANLIFHPIPKCANSSLLLGFLQKEGVITAEEGLNLAKMTRPLNPGRIQDLAMDFKIRSYKKLQDLNSSTKSIAFIRHPIQRLASAIIDKLILNTKLYPGTDLFDFEFFHVMRYVHGAQYWRGEVNAPEVPLEVLQEKTITDFIKRYLLDIDTSALDWHFIPYAYLIDTHETCQLFDISNVGNFLTNYLHVENIVVHEAKQYTSEEAQSDFSLNSRLIDLVSVNNRQLTNLITESKLLDQLQDFYAEDFDLYSKILPLEDVQI